MEEGTDLLAALRLQLEWGADEALAETPPDQLAASARAGRAPGSDGPSSSDVGMEGLPVQTGYDRAGASIAGAPGSGPARTERRAGADIPPTGAGGLGRDRNLGADVSSDPGSARPGPTGSRVPAAGQAVRTPAEAALAAASHADTLDALRTAIASFDGCRLRDTATRPVLPEGDPSAELLLIGEAPNADEDRSGRSFAAREGALLDRMLASIGLQREALLLTPLIPWRPPGGRPPSPAELAICLPFLHRLIGLAGPQRLVILGSLAVRALLGPQTGRRHKIGWMHCAVPGVTNPLPALVLPAPGMMLRTPALRRDAWANLRLLRRTLDGEITQS